MVGVYTTPADVAVYLQRAAFDGSSKPTETTVNGWIEDVESFIEDLTKTAWKEITITDEYHPMDWRPYRRHRIHRPRIALNRRPIKDLSSADKIEVFNGSEYIDWRATKTEGRGEDFWVNQTDGIVHFNRGYPYNEYYEDGVRFTYRIGNATVEGWVKNLATLMTARRVAQFDKKRLPVQGGEGNPARVPLDRQISQLTEEIDGITSNKALINKYSRPGLVTG